MTRESQDRSTETMWNQKVHVGEPRTSNAQLKVSKNKKGVKNKAHTHEARITMIPCFHGRDNHLKKVWWKKKMPTQPPMEIYFIVWVQKVQQDVQILQKIYTKMRLYLSVSTKEKVLTKYVYNAQIGQNIGNIYRTA